MTVMPARLVFGLLVCLWAASASAQTTRPIVRQASDPPVGAQAYFHGTWMSFTATDSFDAVLGDSVGPLYGGGVLFTQGTGRLAGLFLGIEFERFKKDGERVFVHNREVFPLGIRDTVTITPLVVSLGYKLRVHSRVIPYVMGGISSYRYEEDSDFAQEGEDFDDRFTGYHFGGGAEIPLWRWLGVGLEGRFTTVPDALGETGVSAAFGEDDLGGVSARFKVIVGQWTRRRP